VEHGLDLIRNADRLAGDLGGDVHHYHSPMQIARIFLLKCMLS
jgi:hypothetical protein